jgi:thioesterase domain-containing protein
MSRVTPPHIESNKQHVTAFWNEILGRATSVIVPLNESRVGIPLYLVHALSGAVTGFRHLAQVLGPEQAFYGIQAPTNKRNPEFACSIESIARHYIDALMAFQPEGRFAIGGWSLGSTIALEMAQQLRAGGREVVLLVALDGAPFNTSAVLRPWNPSYYYKLACNLPGWIIYNDLIRGRSFRSLTKRISRKARAFWKMATSWLCTSRISWGDAVEGLVDIPSYTLSQIAFMKALFASVHGYVPKEYSGDVVVYAAKTKPLCPLRQVEAVWAALARRAEIVPVVGIHSSIIEAPHVIPLAEHLRTRLKECYQRVR